MEQPNILIASWMVLVKHLLIKLIYSKILLLHQFQQVQLLKALGALGLIVVVWVQLQINRICYKKLNNL